VNAGHRRRNGAIRTTELRVGLGIPALELTHAAIEPDEKYLLIAPLELFCDRWRQESAQPEQTGGGSAGGQTAQHAAAGEAVIEGVAEGRVHGFRIKVSGSALGVQLP
jgi:hypothetical protein